MLIVPPGLNRPKMVQYLAEAKARIEIALMGDQPPPFAQRPGYFEEAVNVAKGQLDLVSNAYPGDDKMFLDRAHVIILPPRAQLERDIATSQKALKAAQAELAAFKAGEVKLAAQVQDVQAQLEKQLADEKAVQDKAQAEADVIRAQKEAADAAAASAKEQETAAIREKAAREREQAARAREQAAALRPLLPKRRPTLRRLRKGRLRRNTLRPIRLLSRRLLRLCLRRHRQRQ
jgi:hypothetical protein